MLVTKYNRNYPNLRGFDLFNDFLTKFEEQMKEESTSLVDFVPAVNTREDEKAYYVEVDLPGVDKKDVEINVEDNILTISGKREFKKESKKEDYYKIESSYGTFSRSFTLPEKVDTDKIEAKFEDGVLEIVIPKLNVIKSSGKKIAIK